MIGSGIYVCPAEHRFKPHPHRDGYMCENCGQYAVRVRSKYVLVFSLPPYEEWSHLKEGVKCGRSVLEGAPPGSKEDAFCVVCLAVGKGEEE